MTDTENAGIFVLTKAAPIINLDLFSPRAFKDPKTGKDRGEPKYGCRFLFTSDHVDLAGLKAKMLAVGKSAWPDAELNTIKWPLRSGTQEIARAKANGKKAPDFLDGKAILSARSKFEPRLSGWENNRVTDYEGDAKNKAKSKFYSGVEALGEFNFVANEVDGKRSVTCYLNQVFTTGKGKRMGGGQSAQEAFKGYTGHATQEDPTGGDLDDEIPF